MSLKQFLDQTGLQELITKFTDWCKQSFLGKNDKASNASKLDVADTGNIYKPVFFNNGVPVACEHKLESDVPANAKFTDTVNTYVAGAGISINGNTINNAGVRSIGTGSVNGTISVNSNGTTLNVAVKGLGSAAYTNSNEYATANHNHDTAYSQKNHTHATDTALSDSSTNPVQNKVIKSYIDTKADDILQEAKNYTDNHSSSITIDESLSSISTNPVQNKAIVRYIQQEDEETLQEAKNYTDSHKCVSFGLNSGGSATVYYKDGTYSPDTFWVYTIAESSNFAIYFIPAKVFSHTTKDITNIQLDLRTGNFQGKRLVNGFVESFAEEILFPLKLKGRNYDVDIHGISPITIDISHDAQQTGTYYAPVPALVVVCYNP